MQQPQQNNIIHVYYLLVTKSIHFRKNYSHPIIFPDPHTIRKELEMNFYFLLSSLYSSFLVVCFKTYVWCLQSSTVFHSRIDYVIAMPGAISNIQTLCGRKKVSRRRTTTVVQQRKKKERRFLAPYLYLKVTKYISPLLLVTH